LEKKHVVENETEERVHLVDFEDKEECEEETLENENVVENDAEDLVQLVDFEEMQWWCEEIDVVENDA
jgi:hypothetical protein